MTYLILQLWTYLLCTAAIGLLLGWIIWGWFGRRRLAEANAFHEKRHLSLERSFEADRIMLEEGRAAACLARKEALKTKASMIGEIEGERRARADANAEIERLIQAEAATREQVESRLTKMQTQLELERSTAREAKEAVGAIREDMALQLREKQVALSGSEDAVRKLWTKLSKLETEAKQGHDELERRLGLEREANATLQAERRRDQRALSEAKDLIDTLRADMNSQLHARQAATFGAANTRTKVKAKTRFETDAPRPSSLHERRPDVVDDLKDIKGIGPVMERILNENGCYHFQQLASFSKQDLEWISAAIETFPDRIERDDWVSQAKALYLENYGRSHEAGEARTLETTS